MKRTHVVRAFIFLATTVGSWGLLSVGASEQPIIEVGQVAARDYEARFANEVIDQVATEDRRQAAADAVPNQLRQDTTAEQAAIDEINEVLATLMAGVIDTTAPIPLLNTPDQVTPSTEAGNGGSSTTGTASATVEATGRVYLDVDGDGAFTEGDVPDRGLGGISVYVYDVNGARVATGETQSDGTWSVQIAPGPISIAADPGDPEFPEGLTLSTANGLQSLECVDGGCEVAAVGYRPAVRAADVQLAELQTQYPGLEADTLQVLVAHATGDVVRLATGEQSTLATVGGAALTKLSELFGDRVTSENLSQVRDELLANPPLVLIGVSTDNEARAAAADLVYQAVRPNYVFDPQLTETAKQEARAGVEAVLVPIQARQRIAQEGDALTKFQIDAIFETGAASSVETGRSIGLLAVLAAMVASIGAYLVRFRPELWTRTRMAALLGILVVLAAGAVRLTIEIQEGIADVAAWYVLPGVAFGLLATVLFDSRIAALMALAMAVLVATGTRDPGVATYALMSTMVPVGFVSSLSSRGAYRRAVLASAIAAGVLASALAWFFHTNPDQQPWEVVGRSGALAAGVTVLTALLGLAVLQFFENVFDVTTSLRLLELTDRNHEALMLLQEKAFGTFNHSLMVGTLADAAARAVGANPLLARAAAYFHDLGKTENPTFFIENQFGASNPHDDLHPRQSVEIIRRHVTDGIALARRYKIPTEVAEAIVSHHGDGIMRYFYEKARRLDGDDSIDPDDFRHVGHKPRTEEMAIVMLSDSLEAACRAVFQEEEPSPQAIEKVVYRVVDEKVNDGQLSECSLTLAQLTRARRAFLEALVGHYHQRIAYPNFPGS
ncbi:MAG: HD family phosphohydrolase [Actinomycetota bacterium]